MKSRNARKGVAGNRPTQPDDGRAERMAEMAQERLLSLIGALIDLALDATDDAALVEDCIRAQGFSEEELRSLGFDTK